MTGRTGWYTDPDDVSRARWHDGTAWTRYSIAKSDWAGEGAPPPPSETEDLDWPRSDEAGDARQRTLEGVHGRDPVRVSVPSTSSRGGTAHRQTQRGLAAAWSSVSHAPGRTYLVRAGLAVAVIALGVAMLGAGNDGTEVARAGSSADPAFEVATSSSTTAIVLDERELIPEDAAAPTSCTQPSGW